MGLVICSSCNAKYKNLLSEIYVDTKFSNHIDECKKCNGKKSNNSISLGLSGTNALVKTTSSAAEKSLPSVSKFQKGHIVYFNTTMSPNVCYGTIDEVKHTSGYLFHYNVRTTINGCKYMIHTAIRDELFLTIESAKNSTSFVPDNLIKAIN